MQGLALLVVLHIVAFVTLLLLVSVLVRQPAAASLPVIGWFFQGYNMLFILFSPGVTQWIYVLPIWLWLRKRRDWRTAKGLLIGALITAFLNGGCWLTLL